MLFLADSDGSRSSGSQSNCLMTVSQPSHQQNRAPHSQPRTISSFKCHEIKEHRDITAENCCTIIEMNILYDLES